MKVRVLLGLMMFLQYAVWGAWTPILGATLSDRLNASGAETAAVYGVLWLACVITPFIGGQLVDRYMPSQVFLGIAAAICAGAAWMMANASTINGLIVWMWVWSLFYAPTLGITNSIVFHHISKFGEDEVAQERDFAVIRTAGTIGWIVSAFLLSFYLGTKQPVPKGTWAPFEEMQLTAVLGVLLAILAFLLPNTPPNKEVKDPWAFLKAFRLFATVPGFTAFMIISFVVSTEFQFFYVLSAPFLSGLGIPHRWLSVTKSISQIAEIVALAVLLPVSLKYLGMRKTLVIGVMAWPLRYLIFSLQQPLWLVVFSLTFHGIGFAFVFVTSQIYVDRVAPKDIRASAQSLLTLITLGIGNWFGTYFCGKLKDYYTKFVPDPNNPGVLIPDPASVNWPMIFLVPAIITILCGIAFWFTFKEPSQEAVAYGEAELETVGT
jgi:nucleoside transporter